MKSKKLLAFICALMVGTSILTGCSSKKTAKSNSSGNGGDTDWPKKTIQIVVPFSAGGDTDYNARVLAKYLEKELGQPVVISNVTGSGGTIAATQVKNSKNDGYTILFTHVALNISTAAGIIDYSYADFEMGGIVGRSIGDAVLVRGDSPWNSIQDMIADTKANPGKYKIAANTGATTHWVAIALKNAGAQFNIVNSGSASERVPALLGGHVDVICNSIASVKDYLKTGKFKALAVANDKRAIEYPNIPTMKESGVDIHYYCAYTAMFPKGTDAAIIEKFNKAVKNIVENNAEYKKEIYSAYLQQPYYLNAEESKKYYADELAALMKISDQLKGK